MFSQVLTVSLTCWTAVPAEAASRGGGVREGQAAGGAEGGACDWSKWLWGHGWNVWLPRYADDTCFSTQRMLAYFARKWCRSFLFYFFSLCCLELPFQKSFSPSAPEPRWLRMTQTRPAPQIRKPSLSSADESRSSRPRTLNLFLKCRQAAPKWNTQCVVQSIQHTAPWSSLM